MAKKVEKVGREGSRGQQLPICKSGGGKGLRKPWGVGKLTSPFFKSLYSLDLGRKKTILGRGVGFILNQNKE